MLVQLRFLDLIRFGVCSDPRRLVHALSPCACRSWPDGGSVLLAHEFAARNGIGLRLLTPGRSVRRVEGADQVLTICESLEKARLP